MTFSSAWRYLRNVCYVALNRRRFGGLGRDCRIYSPLKIVGKPHIFIGDRVVVEYKTWLAATPVEAGRTPRLEIGEGTNIGHFNHIYATRNIKIGRHVLTADRVYISDNLHGYEDVDTPVLRQPVRQIAPVEIGDGSWLGEGVCVIGAKIGKGCVIGANAVVTKDVPDYSVAVGIPARIIKRYYPETKQWITLK